MDSVSRGLAARLREQLRETFHQLSVLNHTVGGRLGMRDVDLDCLDLVQRLGPIAPSELVRRTGVHPATLTGILDRLERAGWVARERSADDRRAVLISARKERMGEIFGLYAGMLSAMDDLCSGYTEAELTLLNDFLGRVAGAGRTATDDLSESTEPPAGA